MKKEDVGDHFLVRLGKTRLRPGGKLASDWLIANGDFRASSKVLEVGCNTANTAIEITKQFGCQVIGVDVDEEILGRARQNIIENELENVVKVQSAKATALPFEDNTFDIVINEAMLTTFSDTYKEQAIREYRRVLKPNGFLLTHDIMLSDENANEVISQLQAVWSATATPLTKTAWKTVFLNSGFRNVEMFSGEMNLLSPKGLIDDEGIIGAVKVLGNALKAENREAVKTMFKVLNDPENKLGFIAVCSQK